MSQTETHIGKLSKIPLGHHTVEEWCEEYCTINGIKMSSYHNSWVSCFMDNYYDEYIIYEESVYKIIEDYSLYGEDISISNYNSNGEIEYIVQYYNGGCGFSEAIEYALDNLEKEQWKD